MWAIYICAFLERFTMMVYALTIRVIIYMKCYKVGILLFCHRNMFRHEQPYRCCLILWHVNDQLKLWIVS